LDDALVAAARATFSRVSPATRAYSLIQPSSAAQSIPPWRPADALGAGGVGVFVRRAGKPLTEGVPGFYTVDGFHKVLLPALGNAAGAAAKQSAGTAATQAASNTASQIVPNAAQGIAQSSISAASSQLTPLLAAQGGAKPPPEPGKEIDEHYRPLREYVGSGP